jgi:hypothetical protein
VTGMACCPAACLTACLTTCLVRHQAACLARRLPAGLISCPCKALCLRTRQRCAFSFLFPPLAIALPTLLHVHRQSRGTKGFMKRGLGSPTECPRSQRGCSHTLSPMALESQRLFCLVSQLVKLLKQRLVSDHSWWMYVFLSATCLAYIDI